MFSWGLNDLASLLPTVIVWRYFLRLIFLDCDSALLVITQAISHPHSITGANLVGIKGVWWNAKEGGHHCLLPPSLNPHLDSSTSTPQLPGHCPRGCFNWSRLACPWKAASNSQNNSLAILSFFFFFILKNHCDSANDLMSPFLTSCSYAHTDISKSRRQLCFNHSLWSTFIITFWPMAHYLHLSFEKGRLGVQEGYKVYLKATQETNCRGSPGDQPFQHLLLALKPNGDYCHLEDLWEHGSLRAWAAFLSQQDSGVPKHLPSDKFPGGADAAGLGTTGGGPLECATSPALHYLHTPHCRPS